MTNEHEDQAQQPEQQSKRPKQVKAEYLSPAPFNWSDGKGDHTIRPRNPKFNFPPGEEPRYRPERRDNPGPNDLQPGGG